MRDPPKQRRPAASTPEAGSIARPGGATFAQPAHDPSEPRQVIQQRSTCLDRPCSSMLNIGHSPHAGRRERCPGGASTASAVGSLASPRRDSSPSTGLTIPFASGAAGTKRARSTGSRNSDRRRRTFALLRLADDSYQRGGVAPAERPARSLSGKAIVRIPSPAGRCSLRVRLVASAPAAAVVAFLTFRLFPHPCSGPLVLLIELEQLARLCSRVIPPVADRHTDREVPLLLRWSIRHVHRPTSARFADIRQAWPASRPRRCS
jgi:hypothetical protein